MNLIANIAKRNYLASTEDVESLARSFQNAQEVRAGTRGTYFRILLAKTQAALLGKPVLRTPRGPSKALTDADIQAQLEALKTAAEPLYAAVLRGVDAPGLDAQERNRRTVFARSATATIRSFIRGGGDLRRVNLLKASKNAMRGAAAQGGKALSPEEAARKRIQRAADRLAGYVEELAQTNRTQAVDAIRLSMDQVSAVLLKYSGRPTDKAATAIAEHRPFKTDAGLFLPAIRLTEAASARSH